VVALISRLRGPMIAAAEARPDDRPPLPHITIARPPRAASPATRKQAVAWAESKPAVGAVVVLDRLVLYTWSDDRRQRQFRQVRELKLIDAATAPP
jgi:2'-5' RNA ligase